MTGMTTDQHQEQLVRLRKQEHAHCVVCGSLNPIGLQLDFRVRTDGCVEASFLCNANLQGYASMLHGGVISALLDGAMTNCLFAHGISSVTGELTVRIFRPVSTSSIVKVEAHLERSLAPLYYVAAKLFQGERIVASATGKFMESQFAEKQERFRVRETDNTDRYSNDSRNEAKQQHIER